jgi:hypothetical protein
MTACFRPAICGPVLEQSNLQTIVRPRSELTVRRCFAASRYLLRWDVALIVSNVSLEADDVNRDESSDNELPSLRKLLSPKISLPRNPPRSHSLNQSVLTSTLWRCLFNYPEWSVFQYPSTQAPNPKIQADDQI